MAEFDIQIKGGTIVDGTRVPRYRGDVWIKDGKVAQLGGRASGFAKKSNRRGRSNRGARLRRFAHAL
jgi:N-acyl-D-aspartate/D-glutamate deacylase